jgi:hypothetical protein
VKAAYHRRGGGKRLYMAKITGEISAEEKMKICETVPTGNGGGSGKTNGRSKKAEAGEESRS